MKKGDGPAIGKTSYLRNARKRP